MVNEITSREENQLASGRGEVKRLTFHHSICTFKFQTGFILLINKNKLNPYVRSVFVIIVNL